MATCTPISTRGRRALLAAAALTVVLPAAPAAAGTLALPAPEAGEAAVFHGSAARGAKPRIAAAPKGVAVLGAADRRGRLVLAVVRPPGAQAGTVRLRARGRLRAKRRAGGDLPAAACAARGPAAGLARVLRRGALRRADAAAFGAALRRRACGQAPAAGDAALLQRLGFAAGAAGTPASTPGPTAVPASPAPAPAPARPGGEVLPPPSPAPKPAPEEPGSYGACRDGVDNDGDGQTDALGESGNPDPGCMNGNDRTEDSETTASAACRAVSGVSRNTPDPREAFAAVNSDCGYVNDVVVSIQPGVLTCDVYTAVNGYVCAVQRGVGRAYQYLYAGPNTDVFDMPILLTGPVDCSKPATIALQRPDFTVDEIVEPVQNC